MKPNSKKSTKKNPKSTQEVCIRHITIVVKNEADKQKMEDIIQFLDGYGYTIAKKGSLIVDSISLM